MRTRWHALTQNLLAGRHDHQYLVFPAVRVDTCCDLSRLHVHARCTDDPTDLSHRERWQLLAVTILSTSATEP